MRDGTPQAGARLASLERNRSDQGMRLTRHLGVMLAAGLATGVIVGLTSAVLLAPTVGTPATEARAVVPSRASATPALPSVSASAAAPSPADTSGTSATASPTGLPSAAPTPTPAS